MVSLLTALTIQANGGEVGVYEEKGRGYGFEIYSIIRERYRPHLSSEPVFDSKEDAERKGREILEAIQSMDLDKKREELSEILGHETSVVQKIIDASKRDV
jgi:hypothetical protein